MGIREEIKALIAKEATTLTDVAAKLTKNKDKRAAMNSISQKLRNKTISYNEIERIADILGYDIKFEKRK